MATIFFRGSSRSWLHRRNLPSGHDRRPRQASSLGQPDPTEPRCSCRTTEAHVPEAGSHQLRPLRRPDQLVGLGDGRVPLRLALLRGWRHALGEAVVGRGVVSRDVDDFVAIVAVIVVVVIEGVVQKNFTFNPGKMRTKNTNRFLLLQRNDTFGLKTF